MSQDDHSERRFPWGKATLITLALLLLAFIGGYWLMGNSAERKLLALANRYGKEEPIYPEDFKSPPIPAADNAVFDLRAAADTLHLTEQQRHILDNLPEPALPLTDQEMHALREASEANSEALRLAHAATAKSGIDWNLPLKTPVIALLLPDLQSQKQLAQFLKAAALHAHQAGDEPAALQRIGDILFLARAVNQQPILVSHMVATGMRAMASQCALEIAPDLHLPGLPATRPSAKPAERQRLQALIAQLFDEETPRKGLVRAFQGERMAQLDTVRFLASGQVPISQLTGGMPNIPGQLFKPFIYQDGMLMLRYTTQFIDAAALPDLPSAKAKMPDRNQIPRGPLHLTAGMLLPALDRAITMQFRSASDRRAAATALALHLYAADHAGQLPGTLADLVPAYLPAVPLDPFTAGKPLSFAPDSPNPILYSVGENGLDEQGDTSPAHPRTDPSCWDGRDAVYPLTRQPRKPPEEDPTPDTPPPATQP